MSTVYLGPGSVLGSVTARSRLVNSVLIVMFKFKIGNVHKVGDLLALQFACRAGLTKLRRFAKKARYRQSLRIVPTIAQFDRYKGVTLLPKLLVLILLISFVLSSFVQCSASISRKVGGSAGGVILARYPEGGPWYESKGSASLAVRVGAGGGIYFDVSDHCEPIMTVKDIAVDIGDYTYLPGYNDGVFNFYLSPDKTFLIIDRGLTLAREVAYIYKRAKEVGGLLGRRGERLDESIINDFANAHHFRASRMAQCVVRFSVLRWMGRFNVVYSMYVCSYGHEHGEPPANALEYDWNGVFDLRSLRTVKTFNVHRYDPRREWIKEFEGK